MKHCRLRPETSIPVMQTKVAIKHADEKRAEIIVPDNPGKQLHLILELTDNGTPNLKSYKRVILNVN